MNMAAPAKISGKRGGDDAIQFMITAAEAYPVLERLFLEAKSEIVAGFRVFDLMTRLRSDAARKIGDTWFDLMVHTLDRGVAVNFTITDFDPIAAAADHQRSWRSYRQFAGVAECTRTKAKLKVRIDAHPARVGRLPRFFLKPMIHKSLADQADELNALPADQRAAALRDRPLVRPWLKRDEQGNIAPCIVGLPPLIPATHHQKLAVFDGQRLFIGGLDLNERRYDTPDHDRPAEETWHDVQMLADGPVAAVARDHLLSFSDVANGNTRPLARDQEFIATLSQRRRVAFPYISPRPLIRELSKAHHAGVRSSRRLVYFETQFFRDRRLARTLAAAARRHPDLDLVLILPAAPEDIAFDRNTGLDARMGENLQARCIRLVEEAFGDRAFIGTPVQPRNGDTQGRDSYASAPLIYVHAKVSIFDDHSAIVSSANLNGRSMAWDTEAGLILRRPEDISALRERTWRHWLPDDATPNFFDPDTACNAWRRLANRNVRSAPDARRGFLVPYNVAVAERFGQPIPVIPEEMV